MHRAHYELFTRHWTRRTPSAPTASVLVHLTCGPTVPGDIPGTVRYKTYEVLKEETANPRTFWAYLPYSACWPAASGEAIHHMMIRKNFGRTHFIIGCRAWPLQVVHRRGGLLRPTTRRTSRSRTARRWACRPCPLNLVYCRRGGRVTAEEAKEKELSALKLSGTKFRKDAAALRDPVFARLQVRRGVCARNAGVFYPPCAHPRAVPEVTPASEDQFNCTGKPVTTQNRRRHGEHGGGGRKAAASAAAARDASRSAVRRGGGGGAEAVAASGPADSASRRVRHAADARPSGARRRRRRARRVLYIFRRERELAARGR